MNRITLWFFLIQNVVLVGGAARAIVRRSFNRQPYGHCVVLFSSFLVGLLLLALEAIRLHSVQP